MSKQIVLVAALAAFLLPGLAAADSCSVLPDTTRRCQETVGKAAFVYGKLKLKTVQLCLRKIQRGDLSGDPQAVCRGSLGVPPTDPTTAGKLASAEAKVLKILQAKCTDGDVAALGLCSGTVGGLATCLVDDQWPRLEAALDAEFGAVAQTGDLGEQTCQSTIAKEGGKFLTKYLRTVQKCINTRNKKECGLDARVSRCLSPRLEGPKAEAKAAKKIQKAEDVMTAKVQLACTDAQVGALAACGGTTATLIDCLACTHRQAADLLTGGQYTAVRVANTGTGIQPVMDQANAGDTVLIEPGLYTEAVLVKDPGLSMIGIKDCASGARAVVESPNPGVTQNGIEACGSIAGGCANPADDLLIQGVEVHNFEDNAIFVAGADGVTFRDVVTIGDGTATGMEYGPFPVVSNDVVIEDSEVFGVRDAGIYVGQSTNIVVRNNVVHDNVAGIEIENSANSKVYGNHAYGNTGGILVFKLPGLAVQLSNCNEIHDNLVENNNTPNFGSGTVGLVPRGTGMIVLSGDTVHLHDNTVTGHDTMGIATTDQSVLNLLAVLNGDPKPFPTPSPDMAVQDNFYVDNVSTGNGGNPDPDYTDFASDVLFFTLAAGTSGNCQSGNTFVVDGQSSYAALPACTLAEPPGCPLPLTAPVPSTTTTTVASTTTTSSPSTTTSSPSTTTTTTLPASFAAIQAAVLGPTCGGCHPPNGGGLALDTCANGIATTVNVLSARYPAMDRIEPFDSANSWLIRKLEGTQSDFEGTCTGGGGTCGGQMPPSGGPLPQQVIDALKAWIDAGAVDDCAP